MLRKALSVVLVVLMIAALMAGCAKKEETVFISIGTGGTGGTYYPLGGAMAKIFNDKIENVNANVQSTQASVENIGLVGKGEVEIAFIQNDITFYAFNGTEIFAGKDKIQNVRGMAMLYPEVVQIIALKDSNIKSVEDLRGKKVAVGAPGSGAEANARQILEAHGLKYTDLAKADFLSFNEAADQLKNKQIDAAFLTAGIPTSAVSEVSQTTDIVVVSMNSGKLTELKKQYPFYTEIKIPANTYKGQTSDVTTAAVMAMLVVKESLSDDLVYKLTKALYENRQVIIETHARGNDIKLESALSGMPIKVHPGAQKYYNEKGVK